MIRVHNQFSSADGTVRYLLRLSDEEFAEAVRIPSQDRVTICISSQVGCALGCAFCLTAQLGLTRDLSSDEIVGQVNVLAKNGERSSIVFMGMGEPLANYDNVLDAIRYFHDDHGLKMPMSRITISTAGLVPAIQRLADEPVFPNLSISLTGVRNEIRDRLMPINRKYPIEAIMETVHQLPPRRQKRVMFECVMMKGVTDSVEDAEELSRLLQDLNAKVNLIPLNSAEEIPFERPDDATILRFQEVLLGNGITTFIRKNRGSDVYGACGQLMKKTSLL